MHENRETSGASRSDQDRDRLAKAQSHNANTHAPEESDCAVVPMNQPNKEEQSSAEVGEGRARAKENIVQSNTLDSGTPRFAPLSHAALRRHSSKVGAVCVDAHVRFCAGGDQRWSSLPRHLSALSHRQTSDRKSASVREAHQSGIDTTGAASPSGGHRDLRLLFATRTYLWRMKRVLCGGSSLTCGHSLTNGVGDSWLPAKPSPWGTEVFRGFGEPVGFHEKPLQI